ncbi:hypothetical protein STRDD10_01648 [Streptococcus sp. DD10]|nr:hypothetical protein STRDD10_01648 [Streptococcus sp. DD10]
MSEIDRSPTAHTLHGHNAVTCRGEGKMKVVSEQAKRLEQLPSL